MALEARRPGLSSTGVAFKSASAVAIAPKHRLGALLEGLSPEQTCELLALIWLGRGDAFGSDRTVEDAFAELNAHAEKKSNDEGTPHYVMEKPVHDYIAIALKMNPAEIVPPPGHYRRWESGPDAMDDDVA